MRPATRTHRALEGASSSIRPPSIPVRLVALLVAALAMVALPSCRGGGQRGNGPRFEISFPESVSNEPLTGRMFLAFAVDEDAEPRLQVGRYGVPFFGVDFERLEPGRPVTIDADTLGYPVESLAVLPAGDYYVQAVLSQYTRFERADGHTVWMHMDQWEGQNWRRSPGNVISKTQRMHIDPAASVTHSLEVTDLIPPIEIPEDTEWVKRIKIQSD
ncbi:MAG: hypothetical protein ACE5HV_11740, partial [Acidobacteriota bacterium]